MKNLINDIEEIEDKTPTQETVPQPIAKSNSDSIILAVAVLFFIVLIAVLSNLNDNGKDTNK